MSNDVIFLRRWMIIVAIALIGGTFTAAQWIIGIETQVEDAVSDIPQMRQDVSTALQVLADHGTELQGIRDLHAEFLGTLNGLRGDMKERTQKRYTSQDAERDWRFHERQHQLENGGKTGQNP